MNEIPKRLMGYEVKAGSRWTSIARDFVFPSKA